MRILESATAEGDGPKDSVNKRRAAGAPFLRHLGRSSRIRWPREAKELRTAKPAKAAHYSRPPVQNIRQTRGKKPRRTEKTCLAQRVFEIEI